MRSRATRASTLGGAAGVDGGRQRDVAGDAGVARRAEEVVDAGFLAELPAEGVLARPGADDEDTHGSVLSDAGSRLDRAVAVRAAP